MYWGWGPMMGWGFGAFATLFMGVFWLLVVGLIVWGVIALARRAGQGGTYTPGQGRSTSPIDVVRIRYARGEIDKAEFDQLMSDLSR